MLPTEREMAVDVIEVDSNRLIAGGITMATYRTTSETFDGPPPRMMLRANCCS